MRTWFSRHPVWFMAFYMVFYLTVFHWLEVHGHGAGHLGPLSAGRFHPVLQIRHRAVSGVVRLDPFTLFYLLWKAPRADFWRLCLPLFAGMTFALACYIVLPTGLYLRPYRVYGNDIFAQAVRLLYATDTPTSVCPSIHVFNSVTLMLAYYRSRIFDAPRRRWMRPAAAVLCVSIVLATVLLKQHSCIDVMMGILLALVLDSAMALRDNDTSRVPERL